MEGFMLKMGKTVRVYCEDCVHCVCISKSQDEPNSSFYVCAHPTNIKHTDSWLRKEPSETTYKMSPAERNKSNTCDLFEYKGRL